MGCCFASRSRWPEAVALGRFRRRESLPVPTLVSSCTFRDALYKDRPTSAGCSAACGFGRVCDAGAWLSGCILEQRSAGSMGQSTIGPRYSGPLCPAWPWPWRRDGLGDVAGVARWRGGWGGDGSCDHSSSLIICALVHRSQILSPTSPRNSSWQTQHSHSERSRDCSRLSSNESGIMQPPILAFVDRSQVATPADVYLFPSHRWCLPPRQSPSILRHAKMHRILLLMCR